MKITNVDWPLIVATLLPWISIAMGALIMPRFSRPDLFFAVTVSLSFRQSPEGREILRRYDRAVVLVALLALAPIVLVNHGSPQPLVITGLLGPMALELAGWFGAFIVARKHTLPHHIAPSTAREAELQPRQVSLAGGWLAQTGPFLILGLIGACLWLHWDSIPARIPIHYGGGGRPDGWAAKSPASVFSMVAIGFLNCLFLLGLWYAIVKGVRRIHSSGSRALREARFIRAMSFFILGMEYWLALLMSMFGLAALRSDLKAPLPAFWLILLGQTLVIGTIFFLAYRAGQGGWRLRAASASDVPETDSSPIGDRTPDECWKLGVFYFNRNDPALFVEKRFGIGWTLNFANPRALLVIGGIVLLLVAVLGISRLTVKGGRAS